MQKGEFYELSSNHRNQTFPIKTMGRKRCHAVVSVCLRSCDWATLRLEKFERLMHLYGDDVITVVGKGLVELVESGKARSAEARSRLESLLAPYTDEQVDAVVLGCTHYPFLREPIQCLFPSAEIFDGRYGTAMRLKYLLDHNNLRSDVSPGSVEYQSSAGPEAVAMMKRLMDALG